MRLALSSCLVLALLVTGTAFAQQAEMGSRLRCLDTGASRLLAQARAWSPSVRSLVDRIEQSDLIVFVRMDRKLSRHRAETQFITAARGARYVIVGINPRAEDTELVAMLGHELQHVSEIADAPQVRDSGGMLALFERIGWPGSSPNGWETDAAVDVGHKVAREIRAAHVLPHVE